MTESKRKSTPERALAARAGQREDRYCAEAWNYSTDVTNMCTTTSNANAITRYEMHGTAGRLG